MDNLELTSEGRFPVPVQFVHSVTPMLSNVLVNDIQISPSYSFKIVCPLWIIWIDYSNRHYLEFIYTEMATEDHL